MHKKLKLKKLMTGCLVFLYIWFSFADNMAQIMKYFDEVNENI